MHEIKFKFKKYLGYLIPTLLVYLSTIGWTEIAWTKATLLSLGGGIVAFLYQATIKYLQNQTLKG